MTVPNGVKVSILRIIGVMQGLQEEDFRCNEPKAHFQDLNISADRYPDRMNWLPVKPDMPNQNQTLRKTRWIFSEYSTSLRNPEYRMHT
jgi:hypothetical protein